MSRKYLFLCLIALLIISGCVDKPQTQAEKVGWNQTKHEEYSEFYDRLLDDNLFRSNEYRMQDIFEIDFKLQEMQQDTEFEKMWYLVFYNYRNGLATQMDAQEYYTAAWNYKESWGDREKYGERARVLGEQAKKYFNKSKEYRQKIEEMKVNLSQ